MISLYWKAISAFVLGMLGWANQVVQSDPGHITRDEWSALIAVLVVVAGVFFVPNSQESA